MFFGMPSYSGNPLPQVNFGFVFNHRILKPILRLFGVVDETPSADSSSDGAAGDT
jgi:hypothetical protein